MAVSDLSQMLSLLRLGAGAALISALLLAGCAETRPATNVTGTSATLHSNMYCVGGEGVWRYAYREVNESDWRRTPDNPFSCSQRTPATGSTDLPVDVTGLNRGVSYLFRFEVRWSDGNMTWWDATGRPGGTNYDRFTTTHPEVPPVDADVLRDSIGVNLHLSYFGTVYEQADRIADKLAELGVRHARQGIWASADPQWRDWNNFLYGQIEKVAARGVDYTYGFEMQPGYGTIGERLAVLSGRLFGTAAGLEGPNEPDLYDPVNWPARVGLFTPHLYTEVKFHPDPAIRALPVAGLSFGTEDGPGAAGDLSQWVDYGNTHPYTGCSSPNPTHLRAEIDRARGVTGDKPLIASEAGFHTALGVRASPDVQPPCDERTAAVYTLRTVLEHYKSGIRRTFLYELLDYLPDPAATDANKHFGLLRNDFSPKWSFLALKNLIAALGNGSAPSLTSLRLDVEQAPADLRTLTLRRADGSYLVMLWRLATVWNRDARIPIAVAPETVRLSLPDAASVAKIEPMSSTTPSEVALVNRGVAVALGGDPVVLRIGL
jgi:hypothetical protein